MSLKLKTENGKFLEPCSKVMQLFSSIFRKYRLKNKQKNPTISYISTYHPNIK